MIAVGLVFIWVFDSRLKKNDRADLTANIYKSKLESTFVIQFEPNKVQTAKDGGRDGFVGILDLSI